MAKGFKGPGMGRPSTLPDAKQIKALMRLKPSLEDTAAFFECSSRTIERVIRKNYDDTFVGFRDKNMVHTRLGLVRKMVEKAMAGDNTMLIWLSKNMLGWTDKQENTVTVSNIKITREDENL
jgi:AraC-like DNA-binding protein